MRRGTTSLHAGGALGFDSLLMCVRTLAAWAAEYFPAAAAGVGVALDPPTGKLCVGGQDLDGLGALFDDPNHKVLAYCRTGTRCANLWVASRAEKDLVGALQTARQIGFDLSMVVPR